MKNLSISLFFIASVLLLVFQQSKVYTNITQPETGRTGAPGETSCAVSGCHGTATTEVTASNTKILLTEFPTQTTFANGYSGNEGKTFGLQVSFKQTPPTYSVYGFSMTALYADDNTPAGSFTTNQNNVSIQSASGRQYVGHKNATSTPNWYFQYELPQTVNRDIIFYIAANGGNNNSSADSGDEIYIAQYKLTETSFGIYDPASSIPINAADISEINIFPNPVQSELNLQFNLNKGGRTRAEIVDLRGATVSRLFETNMSPGSYTQKFSINESLNSGIYLVRIQIEEATYYQKIMVQ